MAGFDVAGILPTVQKNNLAVQTQARAVKTPKIQPAVPPSGPTGFWNRIGQVGIGKVNLANATKMARTVGRQGTATLAEGVESAARVLPGGQNDIKAENNAVKSNTQTQNNVKQLQKSGKITSSKATQLLKLNASGANQTSQEAHANVVAGSEENQSKQGVQMLEATPRAIVNTAETAGKQVKYLAGSTSTPQQRQQIITNQAMASKNPEYHKATAGLRDSANSVQGVIQAQKMAASGVKAPAIRAALIKDQQAVDANNKNAAGNAVQIASLAFTGAKLVQLADKVTGKTVAKDLVAKTKTNQLVQAGAKANARDVNVGKTAVGAQQATDAKAAIVGKTVSASRVAPPASLAEKVHAATIKDGGTTTDIEGKSPTKGYAYAPNKDTEVSISQEKFSPKDIDEFNAKNAAQLNQRDSNGKLINHTGTWIDNGNVYLDVSRVGDASAKTISDAQDAKQLAVYDLEKRNEIPTGQIDKNGVYSKNDEASNIHNQYRRQNSSGGDKSNLGSSPEVHEAVSKEPGKSETSRPEVRKGLGEEGSVNPGQAIKDVQDLIAKHQATTRYSGDIQRGGDEVEGAKKQIGSDAVKVAKTQPKLDAFDKQTLQNYRDAKEAGLPTKELPTRLQKANQDITDLNKASIAAKKEQARLEGKEYSDNINPETYVHREAQGKGSVFDRLKQGSKAKASGAPSFAKRTSSDKGRVYQSITDSRGNRRVIALKNESFGRVKHLTGFEGPDKPINLGKHTYDADTGTLTNGKGEKFKLGQATTSEITKETGQKYYTDPQLTSLKNYVDSRTALENVKYIESIKNHPDFEKFASPPDVTAPKGYEPVHGLFQFQGYKFEPKTAEALRDIVKSSSDETSMADRAGNLLKRTIVYFPLKHNLNQTATYAVDRGLSSLANPMAYKRGVTSLVKAFQEVTNEGPVFQRLQKAGFSLPSVDDQAFTKYVTNELKGISKDDPRVMEIAKSFGTSPARVYNAIQHQAVWQYGDILNVARVIERMEPKLLSKGEDFETAMKNTEKYSLQYKIPSRVGPTKLGRSVSRTLQSPKVFFGRYRYDLYKIMGNTIKDTVNLKSLVTHPGQNLQAVDKLAAMAFGAATVWPLVDKGLQKLTGNPNANISAPGALQIPETVNKVKKGDETPETAVGNQIYPSPVVTLPLEVQANRDSFTGKEIYDPNASEKQKAAQVGEWIKSQSSFGEKSEAVGKSKGNKAVDTILALSGTNLPSNSPTTNKLYSLQYDSLPDVQTQAKADAKKGDFTGAQKEIDSYDMQVLQAAKSALKASKTPIPSDDVLIKKLKTAGTYYAPKPATIRSWKTKTPSNAKSLLGL